MGSVVSKGDTGAALGTWGGRLVSTTPTTFRTKPETRHRHQTQIESSVLSLIKPGRPIVRCPSCPAGSIQTPPPRPHLATACSCLPTSSAPWPLSPSFWAWSQGSDSGSCPSRIRLHGGCMFLLARLEILLYKCAPVLFGTAVLPPKPGPAPAVGRQASPPGRAPTPQACARARPSRQVFCTVD